MKNKLLKLSEENIAKQDKINHEENIHRFYIRMQWTCSNKNKIQWKDRLYMGKTSAIWITSIHNIQRVSKYQ